MLLVFAASALCASCSEDEGSTPIAVGSDSGDADSSWIEAGEDSHVDVTVQDVKSDDGSGAEAAAEAALPCKTRITYGSAWMHASNHPQDWDDVSGELTWDGACAFDGVNSYATLSNGWKPFFLGRGSCVIALDYQNCPSTPSACQTRVSYGPAWIPGPNHPQSYDDVAEAVLWNGVCRADGANSYAALSNGWDPHFTGAAGCDLSFRYTACGGLYANPVIDGDCADPGVVHDGTHYVMACTSGNAADAFPIRVSPDLVHWQSKGHIFPASSKPAWAMSDYWAPEIHAVGNGFVAYFTARHQDGMLSIGAATAPAATGPFTDIGHPLVHDAGMGLIDATHYRDPNGKRYLIWKEDGNAVGKPTPIRGQELAVDGLSLVGSPTTLITNDLAWEDTLVEGPWMVDHGGQYYLFYSGNFFASEAYAIGVARGNSPLGPFTKASSPIVSSAGVWAGPGHGSVLDTPSGETWHIYHSWKQGQIGGGAGRVLLVDRVLWTGGWPSMRAAPSQVSLPVP